MNIFTRKNASDPDVEAEAAFDAPPEGAGASAALPAPPVFGFGSPVPPAWGAAVPTPVETPPWASVSAEDPAAGFAVTTPVVEAPAAESPEPAWASPVVAADQAPAWAQESLEAASWAPAAWTPEPLVQDDAPSAPAFEVLPPAVVVEDVAPVAVFPSPVEAVAEAPAFVAPVVEAPVFVTPVVEAPAVFEVAERQTAPPVAAAHAPASHAAPSHAAVGIQTAHVSETPTVSDREAIAFTYGRSIVGAAEFDRILFSKSPEDAVIVGSWRAVADELYDGPASRIAQSYVAGSHSAGSHAAGSHAAPYVEPAPVFVEPAPVYAEQAPAYVEPVYAPANVADDDLFGGAPKHPGRDHLIPLISSALGGPAELDADHPEEIGLLADALLSAGYELRSDVVNEVADLIGAAAFSSEEDRNGLIRAQRIVLGLNAA